MRFTWTVSLFACLCVAWTVGGDDKSVAGDDKPLVVELWPGKVPDETGDIGPEKVLMSPKLDRKQVEVTEPTRMVTNVSKPTITIYRPAKDKDTGTAMLICPGGGYWNLYWQLEGEEVAAWLNSQGVTGIILKYRVPRRADEPKGEPARRPAPGRPAGRQPGAEQGQGVGHRPGAHRHGRLLGGRPSGDRHGDKLRQANLRGDRRHRQSQLPAGLRHRGLFGLPQGQGQG